MNVRDVLPALLRMCDPEDLEMCDSTTPTALDYIGNYRDGIDVMAYQILQSNQGGNSRPIILGLEHQEVQQQLALLVRLLG